LFVPARKNPRPALNRRQFQAAFPPEATRRGGTRFATVAGMTPTIHKILLPTDFSESSERAVGYAAALARSLGASVHLMHVLEEPRMTRGPLHFLAPDTVAHDHEYHECRTKLAALGATLQNGVARITTEVRIGSPAQAIVDAAVHYGSDLIVMATHGRSGLPHLVLGSVAEQVVRRAPCPVLAVRQSGAAGVHVGTSVA
jgi:universal stress protein A